VASAGDLPGQFQELMDALSKELNETNPITLLAVFALGIFMGRPWPRLSLLLLIP
jgi:hypothetical protein